MKEFTRSDLPYERAKEIHREIENGTDLNSDPHNKGSTESHSVPAEVAGMSDMDERVPWRPEGGTSCCERPALPRKQHGVLCRWA